MPPPPFHVWRPSRKLRQYAGASLTESSFLLYVFPQWFKPFGTILFSVRNNIVFILRMASFLCCFLFLRSFSFHKVVFIFEVAIFFEVIFNFKLYSFKRLCLLSGYLHFEVNCIFENVILLEVVFVFRILLIYFPNLGSNL